MGLAERLPARGFLLCSLSLGFWFLGACATGTPAGGRAELVLGQPQPFSPPASPVELDRVPPSAPHPQDSPASPGPAIDERSATLAPTLSRQPERERIVEFARESLGHRRIESGGQRFQDDCTGLVLAAYAQVGIRLFSQAKSGDTGVTAIHRYVKAHGHVFRSETPAPGDLVFFRETYDANRDGRINDGLTHVGIVEAVDPASSTVTIIHRVSRGVVRYRMNLSQPGLHRDTKTGDVLNDYLRPAGQNQRLTLTGQLFAGYGSLFASL